MSHSRCDNDRVAKVSKCDNDGVAKVSKCDDGKVRKCDEDRMAKVRLFFEKHKKETEGFASCLDDFVTKSNVPAILQLVLAASRQQTVSKSTTIQSPIKTHYQKLSPLNRDLTARALPQSYDKIAAKADDQTTARVMNPLSHSYDKLATKADDQTTARVMNPQDPIFSRAKILKYHSHERKS